VAARVRVIVNPIQLLDRGVELLLLFLEGGLADEDARLTLALVLFFLVRGLLVSPTIIVSWRCRHKIDPSHFLVRVRVGLC
jgi:hypothetical protein